MTHIIIDEALNIDDDTFEKQSRLIQVAPNIFQTREEVDANNQFDEQRDERAFE